MYPDSVIEFIRPFAEHLRDTVLVTTAEMEFPGPEIVYANPAFTNTTGYSQEEVIGKTPRVLQGAGTDRMELKRMRETLRDEDRFFGSILNYAKDGQEITFEWYISPLHDEQGAIKYWISVQHAVPERERSLLRPKLNAMIIHQDADMRSRLREALNSLAKTPEVREVADYSQAVKIVSKHKNLDLILIELTPPHFSNADQVTALRRLLPSVPVVVLSPAQDQWPLRVAMRAGANAYVTITTAGDVLIEILRLVLAGGTFVPWEQIDASNRSNKIAPMSKEAEVAYGRLSRRQKEIGAMLIQGLSNAQIAAQLGIKLATVKGHVMQTCRVLGVKNRTQAAMLLNSRDVE
ncbi:LuxR C-terminal-related transcriptional regulator [Pelagibius sp. Alg239-R121]|uniref:LuxR C-terminal-related transcriptional regulator n=1 Tax=Pelagibius sp. Alg239-R121 TaxID=2993448 RepID=UPI0024A79B36|nr:LuxR C-terminal-related transcriptional regulator [Pelagibius sp. Alg239-R121]